MESIQRLHRAEYGASRHGHRTIEIDPTNRLRLSQRAHPGIPEFSQVGARIAGEALVVVEHRSCAVGVAELPQRKRSAVISAFQVRIERHGFTIQRQRLGMPSALALGLAGEISNMGVVRRTLSDPGEVAQRRFGVTEVEMHQPGDVGRTRLRWILGQHRLGHRQGEALIAFILSVQRRDGLIDAHLVPVRPALDKCRETLARFLVQVLAHQGHALVVARDLLVADRRRHRAAASTKHGRQSQAHAERKLHSASSGRSVPFAPSRRRASAMRLFRLSIPIAAVPAGGRYSDRA